MSSAPCPYCAALLDPAPRTTRACPACGEKIVKRSDGDTVLLFTADQAAEHDRSRTWAAMARQEFGDQAWDAAVTAARGHVGDAYWSMLQEEAQRVAAAGKDDLTFAKLARNARAQIAFLHEEGRAVWDAQWLELQYRLHDVLDMTPEARGLDLDLVALRVTTSNNARGEVPAACTAAHGTSVPLGAVLDRARAPLPHRVPDGALCHCDVEPLVLSDLRAAVAARRAGAPPAMTRRRPPPSPPPPPLTAAAHRPPSETVPPVPGVASIPATSAAARSAMDRAKGIVRRLRDRDSS